MWTATRKQASRGSNISCLLYMSRPPVPAAAPGAAITTERCQVNTWALKSTGKAFPDFVYRNNARIEVSAEENTITLSGKIPGITADSRLAFGVYDDLEGAEEVGCFTRFGFGQSILQNSSDEPAAVQGHSVGDDVPHELVGHIDIRDVTTALDGEALSVTFRLRDVPETLTFDRTGVPAHALEYSWEVLVDVDNDPETGSGGYDYMLSAGYFVPRFAQDSNTVAEITQPGFVEASLWGLDREGYRVLAEAEADVEVSADDNTITLSGEIPGITAESPLKFRAYDFFAGSVEKSSHHPSLTGFVTSPCQSEEAAIRPGQSVVDATSDTLPAYVDLTEVSSALTGDNTLVVVFHLRDVPETLEFFRPNIPEDALEYKWEVSIDVDNDAETGLLGAEYSLAASHFTLASTNGVHLPIREAVQANTWQLDPEGGGVYLSSVSMEVSPEENTITLIGDIPGITLQSRLEFETFDFLNGSEQVACQVTVDSR